MPDKHHNEPSLMPPELESVEFPVKSKEREFLVKKHYDKLARHLMNKAVRDIIVIAAVVILVGFSLLLNFPEGFTGWAFLIVYILALIAFGSFVLEKLRVRKAATALLERIEGNNYDTTLHFSSGHKEWFAVPGFVFLLLFSGCNSEVNLPDTPAFSGVASGADTLVEYPADETFNTFGAVEVLRISDRDTPDILGEPDRIGVSAKGDILIFDSSTSSIHHFNQFGDYLNGFGRPGEGPGEFSNESRLHVLDDELFIFDRLNAKIEHFKLDDKPPGHIQTIPLKLIGEDSNSPFNMIGVDSNYYWLIYRGIYEDPGSKPETEQFITRMSRKEYAISDSGLITLPPAPVMYENIDGRFFAYPTPYRPIPVSAVSDEGELLIGRSDEFEFLRFNADRETRIATRIEIDPIPLTRDDKQNVSGYADRIMDLVEDHMPDHRPPVIKQIVPAENNAFWAGYEQSDSEYARWLHITDSGEIDREVLLPLSFTPQIYEGGKFYGRSEGKDGFDVISVFELTSSE